MGSFVGWVAVVAAILNVVAAAWGAWCAWKMHHAPRFWLVLRFAQAGTGLFALVCVAALATGREPDDGLFWLYVALPLAVGFVAEQLRVLAARTVLDQHGLDDAAALGERSPELQREVVLAIVRREAGVMAAAAAASAFLLLRAAGTA